MMQNVLNILRNSASNVLNPLVTDVDLVIFFAVIRALKGQWIFAAQKRRSFVRITAVSLASRLRLFGDINSCHGILTS